MQTGPEWFFSAGKSNASSEPNVNVDAFFSAKKRLAGLRTVLPVRFSVLATTLDPPLDPWLSREREQFLVGEREKGGSGISITP
jgi:hypothetical protein